MKLMFFFINYRLLLPLSDVKNLRYYIDTYRSIMI